MADTDKQENASEHGDGCYHCQCGGGHADLRPRSHLKFVLILAVMMGFICVCVASFESLFSYTEDDGVYDMEDEQREYWVHACGDVRCSNDGQCVITKYGAACVAVDGARTP